MPRDCVRFEAAQDGKKVSIRVQYDTGLSWWHYHEHEFADETVAKVMCDRLIEGMETRVRHIAKTAYEQGYKDGRGKKKRKTYFTRCINAAGNMMAW